MKNLANIMPSGNGLHDLIESSRIIEEDPGLFCMVQTSLPQDEWRKVIFDNIRFAALNYDRMLAQTASEMYGAPKPPRHAFLAAEREFYRCLRSPFYCHAIRGLRLKHIEDAYNDYRKKWNC